MHDDLVERLRNGCVLHPKRWSGDTHDDLGGSIDEAATDALMAEAAAALEAAREDTERYRWLRMMAKEQLLNPKAAGSECPDMRTYWRIPTLICSGPLGGFIDFDDAIDQARGKVEE